MKKEVSLIQKNVDKIVKEEIEKIGKAETISKNSNRMQNIVDAYVKEYKKSSN